MSNILQIGFTVEGTTDERFLSNIIRKTYENLVFECSSDIEVHSPEFLETDSTDFIAGIEALAVEYDFFHVICVHCDADSKDATRVLSNKINPAFDAVRRNINACKNLVAVVPVRMTEAWMMCDLDLLKQKIGTSMSNADLNLPEKVHQIERIANPKHTINETIRLSQTEISRRRRKLTISDLYSPISQELSIESLMNLPSYQKFAEDARDSLRELNYLK